MAQPQTFLFIQTSKGCHEPQWKWIYISHIPHSTQCSNIKMQGGANKLQQRFRGGKHCRRFEPMTFQLVIYISGSSSRTWCHLVSTCLSWTPTDSQDSCDQWTTALAPTWVTSNHLRRFSSLVCLATWRRSRPKTFLMKAFHGRFSDYYFSFFLVHCYYW